MDKYVYDLIVSSREQYIPVMREKTAELLISIVKSRDIDQVLEIGTCVGVSGLCVLQAGAKHLTTIDIDEDAVEKAKANFRACGVYDKADFIVGDCFEVLKYMENNKYDLIILDGPKGHYDVLAKMLLPMLNNNGVLFADDVDFYGYTNAATTKHKHRTIVNGMRSFLSLFADSKEYKVTQYQIEDGVAVIEKI